ncbi:beta-fructofuranosidase [Friedmanniella luteola]|uniref:beta-fructofuranosidase n=1 Tax=Friedmanniella luteola TaxID=546871 RepID=A0A1H1YNT1_9ACTN|nr:glycoside hydrolase family 32 protein [Friedmanniella luteola]SDT23115.1 beta-fructofuranosidase [Friedmanniella luteola]
MPDPADRARVGTDPTFPRLHGRPRRGWLNDPNGLAHVDGTWHVFFQHNPAAPVHDAIAWGHVSSPDLLHWTEEPLALVPRPGRPDAAGCWSGCVVDDGGVPTAVYTAVTAEASDGQVLLATSDRTLRHWQQAATAVVPAPEGPTVTEVRDPFLVTVDGRRYAVQGAGRPTRDGRPQLLHWACDDLQHWEPLGPLLDDDDPVAAAVAPANIWECPSLVALDGRWVLVLSLWRASGDGVGELAGVRSLVGDLEPAGAGLRFVAASGGVLDAGPAFYAPQLLPDGDRVLLWGWAWELDRPPEQVAAAGWAGVLTFPRELTLVGDAVGVRPARELTALRSAVLPAAEPVTAAAFEVLADGPVGLTLADGDREQPVLDAAFGAGGPVRVLVDGSLVEAFAADGRSLTTRAYPTPTSHWRVDGPARVHRLELPGPG